MNNYEPDFTDPVRVERLRKTIHDCMVESLYKFFKDKYIRENGLEDYE